MNSIKLIILKLTFIFIALKSTFSQNRAIEDGFDLLEDGELIVASDFGVLSNDRFGEGTIRSILSREPENGTISLFSDGSFKYKPNPNFNGEDSFAYSFESQPSSIEFTVDQSRSDVDFSAELTAIGISQTRSDNSSLEGSLQVELTPSDSPFEKIRISGGTLTLSDDVNLRYRFLLFVTAEVSADGGDINLDLIEPGEESSVSANGSFSQTGNDFKITGSAEVNASLDLGVTDGPQSIDTNIEDIDLEGRITDSGQVLTLNLPVSFQGSFDISGNTIDLDLNGTVVATAPKPRSIMSNVAEVILEVDATNDAPNLFPDYYVVENGNVTGDFTSNDFDVDGDPIIPIIESSPKKGSITSSDLGKFSYSPDLGVSGIDSFIYSVPNTTGNVSRALFSNESEWKYLDNGRNPPVDWNKANSNDQIWNKTGQAPLGYGLPSLNTVINFGPSANNKYVTTYFRRDFTIRSPSSIDSFVIDIDRTDSCALYVNGVEVYRDENLIKNANFRTLASNDLLDEDKNISIAVPISTLQDGNNSISIELHKSSRSSNEFKFDLSAVAIIPPFTEIISSGELWKYSSNDNPPSDLWTSIDFDDNSWINALSPLGYGEDYINGNISFGNDPNNKPITAFFRKEFQFTGNDNIVAAKVVLRKDDGVAVYLNGQEIARDNLREDSNHLTFADESISGVAELESTEFIFDSTMLIEGGNVLAAEVHQSSRSSSDLLFDLKLLVSSEKVSEFVYIQIPGEEPVDTDGDGYNDSTELYFGSSSKNKESVPKFESKIVRDSNDIKLLFPGRKGMVYQLQISNDLESWLTLEKLIIGNGSILSEEIPILDSNSNYYRILSQVN